MISTPYLWCCLTLDIWGQSKNCKPSSNSTIVFTLTPNNLNASRLKFEL